VDGPVLVPGDLGHQPDNSSFPSYGRWFNVCRGWEPWKWVWPRVTGGDIRSVPSDLQ